MRLSDLLVKWGFLCINIIMDSATAAESQSWETMSSWSAVMSLTQCLYDVSEFRLATQAQGPVACGLGVISKCHCQDLCQAASPRSTARLFILYFHNHWLGAFCTKEVHLLVFESILCIRSLQRMVGNFLYFRLLNGTRSVTNLCLTIATPMHLNFPKTGSSFSLWTKSSQIQYNYLFRCFWKDQVFRVWSHHCVYTSPIWQCNHEWWSPGEVTPPTKWTGSWWIRSGIKVQFHD